LVHVIAGNRFRGFAEHTFELGDFLRGCYEFITPRCNVDKVDAITCIDFRIVLHIGWNGDFSFAVRVAIVILNSFLFTIA